MVQGGERRGRDVQDVMVAVAGHEGDQLVEPVRGQEAEPFDQELEHASRIGRQQRDVAELSGAIPVFGRPGAGAVMPAII